MTFDVFQLHGMWQAAWTAFLGAAILSWPIYQTLISLKSRQTISQFAPEGHQVKQGTPTMGGLIIVAGIAIGLAVTGLMSRMVWIPLIGFTLIGFVDDFVVPRYIKGKRGLGWKQKISMQVIAAYFGVAGYYPIPATILFVFFVLFYSNAYNFADGLDGMAASLGIVIFGGLALIGLLANYSDVPVVACAVIGGLIPFLFLNAPPAKIFMGDVGSLPIGALLGVSVFSLLVPSVKAETAFMPGSEFYIGRPFDALVAMDVLFVPAIAWALLVQSGMMIAELVPVPLQVASVKLFKKRLFPYTPIHHAFERAGWPETRVAGRFVLMQVLLSATAVAIVLHGIQTRHQSDPRMRTAVIRS